MKKSLLTLSAIVALGAGSMLAQSTTFSVVADTWVRENNPTWKGGSAKTVETSATRKASDGETDNSLFVAMYGFNLEIPAGMKVQSATMHLVTERYKGSDVRVYGYGNDFSESDACWETEQGHIYDAVVKNPVATFKPAGQSGKAIFDGGINEENQNLAAWTNDFDVTNYLKSLPLNTRRVNFLLVSEGGQDCFYTKDVTENENAFKIDDNVYLTTFTPEELKPYLVVTFTEDAAQSSDAILPVVDTFVRSSAANQRYGDKEEMEIYSYVNEKDEQVHFTGLMTFILPAEIAMDSYELQSAELRLVTTYLKGNRDVNLFFYHYDMTEDDKWEKVGPQVEEVLGYEPILTFKANGQGDKSMASDELSDDYKDVKAWTNYIDLTDFVASFADYGKISLCIMKEETSNRAVKFATKEHKGVVNAKDSSVTFAAEDLHPQLVVTYNKTDESGETVVEEIVIDANAPVEFYNLQGIRVLNPDRGIYIVRQGNSVKKVVL